MAQSPRPRRSICGHAASALCTQPLGKSVLGDRAPRRRFADVEHRRRRRIRRVGRQQPAWNANLAVARELDLLCPIAWLANRREDPARQGFNARHLDAKDGANALARVVYRGRPVVSESPRPSAASATALFRRRTMSSRILSACRVNKFDPVTQRADTRVRGRRDGRDVSR